MAINTPGTMFGFRVVVAPAIPKMQLAEDVMVTPEFRKEMNAWMREFFGVSYLVEPGKVLVVHASNTVVMHPDDFKEVKRSSERSPLHSFGYGF